MALSLEDRIALAQASLNKSFGPAEGQEGKDANRFLNEKTLAEEYKLEAEDGGIIQQFLEMTKSIRNMRSSYLPATFFIDRENTDQFSADIADDIAKMESYENTFMRMLGMPSVGTSEFALSEQDSEIRSGETLLIVSPDTGEVREASFDEVRTKILNQRQKDRKTRRILIDNSIYNISENSSIGNSISIRDLNNFEKSNLLNVPYDAATDQLIDPSTGTFSTFTPTELLLNDTETGYINPFFDNVTINTSDIQSIIGNISKAETEAKIDAIEDDIWKFSYLLIPPIQNIEVARCINEPKKIVAPPFSNKSTRTINNNKIRPTLLESVIRIRLDKVSGTDTAFRTDKDVDKKGLKKGLKFESNFGNGEEDVEVLPDSYGVLESLFILRLRSAITGLSHKLYKDIDNIIDNMEKSRRVPIIPDGKETVGEYNQAGDQMMQTEDNTSSKSLTEIGLTSIQEQKLIEDSIMFLLGDNSEILDLQSQTQRNSTIHDAHMMSGLISIIDVPRKRINSSEESIIQSRNDCASECVEPDMQEIGTVLGTDIGIGTIDLAVFALALFTMSEKSLLGLLSTAQFEKIKNGEFKALLPEEGDKEDTIVAINELSQLVIDGYNLFITDLENEVPLN